ncbi:E3 ubiquitin-protein ligase RNF123-like [Meleagris gallopavo]|uniref:E3 ubiquitin-protein ligase RNF123-like n=1 Tax=Meleagris gallopavo TaxID=9103 RepID=UPI000549C234|nr:E3 ubiquitin-protein ligase RNF123-like [Meleagris gallopavo]
MWQLQGELTVLITLAHIFNYFSPLMEYEVHKCLKQLLMSLLQACRFSPIIPDLGLQSPLHVEEAGLQELIPTTWWPNRFTKEGKKSKEVKEESAEERLRQWAYERGCQQLEKRIEDL